NPRGEMQVYTSSGQVLLDQSVHEIEYRSAGSVSAGTVYNPTPPSGFDTISVDGKDITSNFKAGSIAELINLRDRELPAAPAELDEPATELADVFNAVHNNGVAMPPPNSLTGSQTVVGTDPFAGTGTVRFAVTDADGNLVSYQDIDLTAYATVDDLVNAIDGI